MTLRIDGTLLLVGAGNMGCALLAGWLERGLDPRRIVVQEPNPAPRAKELLERHGIIARPAVGPLPEAPVVVLLAVKPQDMDSVFSVVTESVGPRTVVLSIAAGRTIASFERHLRQPGAVVRAMPNTPAAVARGITVAVPNAHVTPAQRTACDDLLRAIGEVAWADDESLLDPVTAVSGSGPAYVFYLAECMAEAGVAAGLRRGRSSPERHLAKRHDLRRAAGAHGTGRHVESDAGGDCGSDAPLARAGQIAFRMRRGMAGQGESEGLFWRPFAGLPR
jgi:pyrroline-5-carboxylate reductase